MPRYFTDEHEWIDVEGESATVGITDYAQEQLGDIVFVELPEVGSQVEKGGEAAVVESVKAAPTSGKRRSFLERLRRMTKRTAFTRALRWQAAPGKKRMAASLREPDIHTQTDTHTHTHTYRVGERSR